MTEQALLAAYKFENTAFVPVLGDSRLVDRWKLIRSAIEKTPGASFPSIFPTKASLEGFYRFINNERVSYSSLMDSICDETSGKLGTFPSQSPTLAIHDTTEFDFSHLSPIEGMGRGSKKKGQGFFAHFCIATTLEREIIGPLGLITWTRLHKPIPRNKKVKKSIDDPTNEGGRWHKLIQQVQTQNSGLRELIHVADRESDEYHCLDQLVGGQYRFVLRVKYNRNINDDEFAKLFDSLHHAVAICEREVDLGTRKISSTCPRASKDHPPRKKRTARLAIAAKRIEICRSRSTDNKCSNTLWLNFVRVFEIDTPLGEEPIEWKLVTSESIGTSKELEAIVDIYKARWTIEEFFKVLKTGCAFEKRGIESYDGLLRCLAIFTSIAYQIYNLKIRARQNPDYEAKDSVTTEQIKILAMKTPFKENELRKIGVFLLAVAALGGHLKHNGPPGWQVLFRGYEKLLQLEQGYLIAIRHGAICVE